MPTKLKNLRITSVDLVDQGANQEAHVSLLKRKATDFVTGLLPQPQQIPVTLTPTKGRARATSPFEDTENQIFKEVNTMTPEEEKILEAATLIEKKYGLPQKETPVEKGGDPVEKEDLSTPSQDEIPVSEDVAKALAENVTRLKGYEEKIQSMEKQLAMRDLETIAKKYELLGNNPQELAEKLYTMKGKGGYEDYIAVLDQSLALVEKSGLFQEIGKSTTEPSSLDNLVEEIQKRDHCTKDQAFIKAYEENGDFARAYDLGYILK